MGLEDGVIGRIEEGGEREVGWAFGKREIEKKFKNKKRAELKLMMQGKLVVLVEMGVLLKEISSKKLIYKNVVPRKFSNR